jgi:hypothetical protein
MSDSTGGYRTRSWLSWTSDIELVRLGHRTARCRQGAEATPSASRRRSDRLRHDHRFSRLLGIRRPAGGAGSSDGGSLLSWQLA